MLKKPWVPRGPEWVSKTNITDYERCPYGFWLMDTGVVNREDVFGIFERELLDAGSAHEATILEEMPTLPPDLTPDQIAERTNFVFNGPILENPERFLVGKPDAIEVATQAPLEIKMRSRAKALDKYELAFYWLLLEPFRESRKMEPYGWLQLIFGEPKRIDLSPRQFEYVEDLIQSVRDARAHGVEPRACGCFICLTRPEVQEVKRKGTDVGLVYGVGQGRKKVLTRLGIRNVHQLCDADPDDVARRIRAKDGSSVSGKMVRRWQDHARAFRDGTVVRLSRERFEHEDFIVLDLEYDAFSGMGKVWLVGALVCRGGETELFQEFCLDKADLRRSLTVLAKLLKRNADLPIITWGGGGADLPHLTAAAKANRVPLMRAIESRHVDLYRLTERSLRFPVANLDLKSLGSHVGIERRSEISDGLEAGIWYSRFRSTRKKKEREEIRQSLLAYNRDDLECLRAVADYVRTVDPMKFGEWSDRETVTVYSIQRERVVSLLRGAEPYRPTWAWSAAGDHPNEYSRNQHREAYEWLVERYVARHGIDVAEVPVWAWLVRDPEAGRQHDDECLVTLEIPRRIALASVHRLWSGYVLFGHRIPADDEINTGSVEWETTERTRASWERIFDVSEEAELSDVQVVFDRIEPAWVKKVEVLGPLSASGRQVTNQV